MMLPREFYTNRLNLHQATFQKITARRKWIGLLRLSSFIITLLLLFLYARADVNSIIPAVVLLLIFLIAVRIDAGLQNQRNFLASQIASVQNELQIMDGGTNTFDQGNAFITDAGYAGDLDLFGEYSLFHLLNRCTTGHGQRAFASRLLHPLLLSSEIIAYQLAVKAYARQAETREYVIAAGKMNMDLSGNLEEVNTWLATPEKFFGKIIPTTLRFLLPLLNIVTAYIWLDNGNYLPFLVTVSLTWIYLGTAFKYIALQHQQVGKKNMILNQYAGILLQFSHVDSKNTPYLYRLQGHASHASIQIKKLASLSEMFDQRMNGLVFVLLNTFFVFDLQIILGLERWKKINREAFPGWLQAVGDIECMNSLSTFAFNNPGYTFPVADESDKTIIAKQMSHPMIPITERVYNDFELGKMEKLVLLTGSNMSGKSTFLRSLGINMILAHCGAPVCADKFVFHPCRLLTCIRITDNLHEHTSYFMAELKKLQQIILQLQEGAFSLVLIDEILRGTNSDDKHFGSEKYIEKLVSFDCLALFATHDVQLGQLATRHAGKIANYCFESTIMDDQIFFDYKLHPGVSKNRNATFLMKQMDII